MKRPRGSGADVVSGGGKGVRTPGLRLAKPALSQLSYTPFRNKHPSGDSALAGVFIAKELVNLTRFELVTSRLSAGRSNQLSYRSIAPGDNTPPARLRQPLFFIAWGASGICTSVHRPRSTMNREPKTSMDSLWWFPCKKNRWSLHIPTLWRFASGRPSRVPARYKVLTRFPQDRCEGHARWTRYARLPAMQGRQPMVRNNNAGHRAAKRPKTLINHTSARRARSAPQLPRTSAAASSACGSARRLLLASLARRVHAPILARLFLGVVALILLCASIPQPANATVSVPPSFANNVTVKKRDAATGALESPITWWDLSDGTWCVCGSVHSNAPSIGDTYGPCSRGRGLHL